MRPFRFVFMFFIGIFFFFFIAKFLFFAFIAALLFFAGRKVLGYSRHRPQMPVWKGDMLVDYPISIADRRRSGRIIEVQ